MEIDYDKLTAYQRQTYDFWVNVAKKPVNEELQTLLGLVAKPKTRIRKEAIETKEAVAREAEAVLLHLRRVDTLMQKFCLECNLPFATNYAYAGRCSDDCIKASLARVGIKWNPEKTAQERWNGPDVNGEIPSIITPETLAFLKNWAVTILSWDEPKGVVPNGYNGMTAGDKVMAEMFSTNTWPGPGALQKEQERMEEDLRQEFSMSGDIYGGTDTTEVDWDSI